jgi:RNA polymerase sigma-70 factor (ECF subfamily)
MDTLLAQEKPPDPSQAELGTEKVAINANRAQLDEALLMQAKAGPDGIAAVYDAYADKLYGFCLKRCGHRETAEDLVSKVFIKFVEHVDRISWQGVSLGAWLFRVASNQMIDHWRSASVRMDESLDDDTDETPSTIGAPDDITHLVLEKEKLLLVMKELSPRDQGVLDLKFFGELEANEIASIINVSPNHAAVLVYRALQRLRVKYIQIYGKQ